MSGEGGMKTNSNILAIFVPPDLKKTPLKNKTISPAGETQNSKPKRNIQMTTKKYDVAVKTGEYQDQQTGEIKGRYENVGVVLSDSEGHLFMTLKRTFNPAGIIPKAGKDSIILSFFEPKLKGDL